MALSAMLVTACTGQHDFHDDRRIIRLWTHVAGNPDELSTIEKIVSDFNASQVKYRVVHEPFPAGDYAEAVRAAAASGNLPCVLDVDGPTLANWAWSDLLVPLDLPGTTVDRFLPSTVGRYRDQVYSIGFYDAALALFARRSVLLRHHLRVPTMERPWTRAEFDHVLVTLKAGGFAYPLDLGTGIEPGEWWSYAYAPMLWSFGGDLLRPNGPAAVAFGQWWQSLFTRGLVNPREEPERLAFLRGEVALAWDGSWAAEDALKVYEDVVFLPPPDFGQGPKIATGSWQWGITPACPQKQGALAYLRHSLDSQYLAAFADRVGLIPATAQATELTRNYGRGGPLRIFAEYLRAYGEPRPATPAYPAVSEVFADALRDIADGAEVRGLLDRAVTRIDVEVRENNNYA